MNRLTVTHCITVTLILCSVLFWIESSHAQQSTISTIQSKNKNIQLSLETPRNFGYTAGDIIQHRIDISIPSGTDLNTNYLPARGLLLDWLDVIDVEIIKQSNSQYNINIFYQVSKQVKETELLEIPMFQIAAIDGTETESITVPAWQFSYYSLIPSRISDAAIIAQSAQKPEALPIQPVVMRLFTSLGAALLCLAYILWRRGSLQFWSRKTTAFQHALKNLKQFPEQASTADQIEQAFRIVHTALNQTAGETVLESQLEYFYQTHPQLTTLRSDTDQFFKQSRQIFYETSSFDNQLTQDNNLLKSLKHLCSRYDRLLKQR